MRYIPSRCWITSNYGNLYQPGSRQNEVEEENNSEATMTAGLLPPINHTCEDYYNRKKRKKKKKHKNNQKEKFINDNEYHQIHNIDNECKTGKKKKKKKSKLNQVQLEEKPFNVEVCKIPPPSNEDDEHAQSHQTEIIKEKSAEVETDSLYGESVGDTQEKNKKQKTS